MLRSDIIAALQQSGAQGLADRVMRRNFPTVTPGTFLLDAHRLMEENGRKAVPVVKGGYPAGIITLEDISRIYVMVSRR